MWDVVQEKPIHRTAAMLFASGWTTREVAKACDLGEGTVRNLLRTPWFQERVTQLLALNGGQDIMALFRSEQFASLATLIEVRDDPKASAAVRAKVANDILDRVLGRAVQRIESTNVPHSSDPVAETAQLAEENKRLQEALAAAQPSLGSRTSPE